MSERKVNLEEIVNDFGFIKGISIHSHTATIHDNLKAAMKEACRQVLILATEKIKSDAMETFGTDINDCWDEQSIINTIKQIT